MDKDLITIFAGVGVVVICVFIVIVLLICLDFMKDKIEQVLYWYKRKHRFDKSPTAACFCIDCEWRNKDEVCAAGNVYGYKVADDWFCWKANPRKKKRVEGKND